MHWSMVSSKKHVPFSLFWRPMQEPQACSPAVLQYFHVVPLWYAFFWLPLCQISSVRAGGFHTVDSIGMFFSQCFRERILWRDLGPNQSTKLGQLKCYLFYLFVWQLLFFTSYVKSLKILWKFLWPMEKGERRSLDFRELKLSRISLSCQILGRPMSLVSQDRYSFPAIYILDQCTYS